MECSIDDCLARISDPNAFYLVLLAARAARERNLRPVEALEYIAAGEGIAQLEENVMSAVLSPVSQAIETVSSEREAEATDRFGAQGMDEESLLRAMEGHLASSVPGARYGRGRYSSSNASNLEEPLDSFDADAAGEDNSGAESDQDSEH